MFKVTYITFLSHAWNEIQQFTMKFKFLLNHWLLRNLYKIILITVYLINWPVSVCVYIYLVKVIPGMYLYRVYFLLVNKVLLGDLQHFFIFNKDLLMSLHIAFQRILITIENMPEANSFLTCIASIRFYWILQFEVDWHW